MNLKSLASKAAGKVARQMAVARKHSPTLMFAAGVIGFGATVVLASRATLKLDDVLARHEEDLEKIETAEREDYTDADKSRDRFIVYGHTTADLVRLYGPSVIAATLTIAALTGSHVVLKNRNTALMAAYAALEKGFNAYRRRVAEELGPEKERQFRLGIRKDEIEETDEKGIVARRQVDVAEASVYSVWFDDTSPNWTGRLEYDRMFLTAQQNYANDRLQTRGFLFLNEVLESLKLPLTSQGAIVGWMLTGDGDGYVDFGFDLQLDDSYGRIFRTKLDGTRSPGVLLDFNVDGLIWDKI